MLLVFPAKKIPKAALGLLCLALSCPCGAVEAPQLTWSSYLGGSDVDDCDDIAIDPTGHVLLACHCTSNDFPGAPRSGDATQAGMDAYVVKLDPRTGRIVYSTRLGGGDYDGALRLEADSSGNAYAVGITQSADFPVTPDALQSGYSGGKGDGFLVKLDPAGSLLYSTFIGGNSYDLTTDVVLDSENGKIYVAGVTASPEMLGGVATRPSGVGGKEDGFVMALEMERPSVVWTAYLGGSEEEKTTGMALSGEGHLWVEGYTHSLDFPVRGALQEQLQGKSDAFLAKLDSSTGDLLLASYLGGSGEDSGWGLALDAADNPHVCVTTNSPDMPVTPSAVRAQLGGPPDAFVAKFDSEGRLIYSTYYGGSGEDTCGYDGGILAIDSAGRAWLVGMTNSSDFPTLNQASYGGGELDGFLAVFSPEGSRVVFATYYGGDGRDLLEGLALTSDGAYLTGLTASRNLPSLGPSIAARHAGGRFDVMLAGFRIRHGGDDP